MGRSLSISTLQVIRCSCFHKMKCKWRKGWIPTHTVNTDYRHNVSVMVPRQASKKLNKGHQCQTLVRPCLDRRPFMGKASSFIWMGPLHWHSGDSNTEGFGKKNAGSSSKKGEPGSTFTTMQNDVTQHGPALSFTVIYVHTPSRLFCNVNSVFELFTEWSWQWKIKWLVQWTFQSCKILPHSITDCCAEFRHLLSLQAH